MKNYKNVAFAAMRMQGFHNGHFNLISRMLRDNDLVIIGLGSTQIEKTLSNPFTPNQRIEMVKKVFGDNSKIKIVHLVDQGAVTKKFWVDYCLNTIFKKNLPTPNRYYSGCETDASWFSEAVNLNEEEIEVINLDRYSTGIMSATEVRKSIANAIINPKMTSNEWKRFVPECLHDYLLENFPVELTLEYQLQKRLKMKVVHLVTLSVEEIKKILAEKYSVTPDLIEFSLDSKEYEKTYELENSISVDIFKEEA